MWPQKASERFGEAKSIMNCDRPSMIGIQCQDPVRCVHGLTGEAKGANGDEYCVAEERESSPLWLDRLSLRT